MSFQSLHEVANVIVTDARRRLDSAQADLEWMTIEERAIFFGELKGYAAEKGRYKPGWPAAKYKARFGYWPEESVKATPELECGEATRLWIKATMRDFWAGRRATGARPTK